MSAIAGRTSNLGRTSILGRAWIFGDNIDTDVIISGVHMKFDPQEIAKYCFEAIAPDFAAQVKDGDIVVGGANFGMGSSREQAPQVLKILGIGVVLASSFAHIMTSRTRTPSRIRTTLCSIC